MFCYIFQEWENGRITSRLTVFFHFTRP